MKRLIYLIFILMIGTNNILSASVESDIKYIKQNMVTKSEFQLYVKMADRRFEDMNKRFEDMNKRFEDINKRFEDINKRLGFIEMILVILIGVVVGTNIYSIIKQNKLYALIQEVENLKKLEEE